MGVLPLADTSTYGRGCHEKKVPLHGQKQLEGDGWAAWCGRGKYNAAAALLPLYIGSWGCKANWEIGFGSVGRASDMRTQYQTNACINKTRDVSP